MQSMQKHGIIVGILFDVKSYVFTVSLRIVDIKKNIYMIIDVFEEN